ncbi:MAG: hydroxymethylglutaryl-CoA lyase [Bacteroidales bacterium]|nr:hydroxymethylglutaryl-CoA lyase [Bacteroidales bacterium]
MSTIRITETVRDALQGLPGFISTEKKTAYIQSLLKVGFDCIDIGSFVSPKAVPQMADTCQVIQNLDFTESGSQVMVLVVNEKGAEKAAGIPQINCISFPYSVSPTFLQRNLKLNNQHAIEIVKNIATSAYANRLEFIVYLSMGFGNPYGDDWSLSLLNDTVSAFYQLGIRNMPLSDILGEASPDRIFSVYNTLIPLFPDVDFGLHLHTKPSESFAKLEAAYDAGVRSFETVLNGLGGCPFAADEMVGNLSTQDFIAFCDKKNIPLKINREAFAKAAISGSGLTS